MAKRAFDLIASVAALAFSIPLLVLCIAAIWLESGSPVFFRQTRLGRSARQFQMFKFRSMFVNAKDLRNIDGSTYNGPNDPRVTRVGKWLRKLSLDELPQLLNVICGEMSIVGPRPDVPDAINHYRSQDHLRLSVKPGMTGWAQVHGRNGISWETRRDLDLQYVERRSFPMDLLICFQTFPMLLLGSGIYIKKPGEEHGGVN